MIITYHGGGMIKVTAGERVLCFNPSSQASPSGRAPRFAADLVLVSCLDPRWNGSGSFQGGDKKALVIDGPGEYETGEIFVLGVPTTGPQSRINTAFAVLIDDLRLVHLGAITSPELEVSTKESLGSVDILFVPVAGDLLGPEAAARLAIELGARLVVPVEHEGENDKSLKKFLHEFGADHPRHEPKLSVRRKDIDAEKSEVVIL